MLRCPECGRDVPEVLGAAEQACPHCGAEVLAPEAERSGTGMVDAAGAAAEAFRFARRHYGGVLLLWVPALVVDVAASLGLAYYEGAHGFPADVGAFTQAQQLSWLGVAAPLLLLTFALKLALFAPVGGFVLDRAGATPEGRSALAATVRSPMRLLALGVMLALLYVAGVFLALVGLLVFYHWFQFAPVALAERQKGIGDAFEASRRFAKERRVFGFTALTFFVLFGALLVEQGLEWLGNLALHGAGGVWGSALVGGLALWLVAPFLAILPAAYWSLAARAEAPGAALSEPQPAPGFRTTKCPQCGTLIPYTATGAPVDVQCPVCGRKGRVI